MTPEEVIVRAGRGELLPVYLVVGDERFLVDQVVSAVRTAALAGGVAGFNEDKFVAGEADVDRVLAAARMLPMMGKRRLVAVRALERWDARADSDEAEREPRATKQGSALDALAAYAAAPVESTCLLLVATKVDGRRKLVAVAKKAGFLVSCEAIARQALPAWIARRAKDAGHALDGDTAELLAEIAGPELSHAADALDRLGLYVGEGKPIGEDDVAACVIRTRLRSVWDLVGALGRRDLDRALHALADAYDPRDRGVRLIGAIAFSLRQMIKFEAAIADGASPDQAAVRAGAPPFKARELAAQTRGLPRSELERWLRLLAAADLELKGSKRPALATVETLVLDMCGRAAAPS